MSININPHHQPTKIRNYKFDAFISSMMELASNNGIVWEIPLDQNGVALSGRSWDLRKIAKDGRPTKSVLRTFSLFPEVLDAIAAQNPGSIRRPDGPISVEWQDFIKAVTIEYLLVRRKSVPFAQALGPALRFLATVVDKDPWQITAEDLQLTSNLADARQPSRGMSTVLQAVMSTVVDRLHLADACPLMALVKRSNKVNTPYSKLYLAHDKVANELAARKEEQKLPEQRAFWEMVRIVFTESPKTLTDALRFALMKVLLITGMRIGEVALLPVDWKRTRSYIDTNGRPAGDSGGISEALLIRHFAEKQGTRTLYETTQFVPEMFRDEIEQTLLDVEKLTAPLRKTLKDQYESGRLFPMYQPHDLVDAVEMYVRLTGNPMWAKNPSKQALEHVERYQKTLKLDELTALRAALQGENALSVAVSRYFSPKNRSLGLILRDANGYPSTGRGVQHKFLRISEVEDFIYKAVPTKVPDLVPFNLDNGGRVAPWEMLFLLPKRAVGAGRGDTILDPTMTYSVGLADSMILQAVMGDELRDTHSIFHTYGSSDKDRKLKLTSHSFRHLQNTELFRLGVADTIITKRFNRRSVAQSYEYDHRSLAEELERLELPDAWENYLGDSKAVTVAKLVQAGRAEGPVVREFRRILEDEGDEPALSFLAAEADGFHATPYGYCLNSFTVDPCPKHLECFAGCRHLSATDLPVNRRNIIQLHGRLKSALEAAEARPAGTIGRDNQIAHAKERIKGLETLLITKNGETVFPNGPDLSENAIRRSVLRGT